MKDRDTTWMRSTHAVKLGHDFKSYRAALEYVLTPDLNDKTKTKGDHDALQELLNTLSPADSKPSVSDSSVGGNDAINPYWSFNEDDDIILPMDAQNAACTKGMGCVYKQMYDQNQQILWLSFGVPQFGSASDFFWGIKNSKLSAYMNDGGHSGLGDLLKALISDVTRGTLALAISLPFMPMAFLYRVGKWSFSNSSYSITKYYDFQSASVLYYQMCNSLLAPLSVGMGLFSNSEELMKSMSGKGIVNSDWYNRYSKSTVPKVLENGPDVFAIINKRANAINHRNRLTTDMLAKELAKPVKDRNSNWFDRATGWIINPLCKIQNGIKNAALGGTEFVGFRVEKGTDASESFNNSTGESSIAGTFNSKVQEKMDKKFTLGTLPGGDMMADVSNILSGIAGLKEGDVLEIVAGNAHVDIPEVWKSSSFSKSYSFNMVFRARYGDPISIFQSVYIPLVMIMAGALPRSVGKNAYTSPFVLRAWCKGRFAIPLGIIESMSIKRGASEFGWNYDNLPTVVEVSINIKDLSPAMYMALADASFLDVFANNTSMQDYISTLSGLGLADRYYLMGKTIRKAQSALLSVFTNVLNPLAIGNRVGSMNLMGLAYAMDTGNVSDN